MELAAGGHTGDPSSPAVASSTPDFNGAIKY